MTPDRVGSASRHPSQISTLATLIALEGAALILFAAVNLYSATVSDDTPEWGAVWFLVCTLAPWGAGLIWVARGLLDGRRWSFTPVLFTQLMFGVLALNFLGSATTLPRLLWGGVLAAAATSLALLFSPSVRRAVLSPPHAS